MISRGFSSAGSTISRGDREKAQILQFFYRRNREGEREEKVIFPFIAVRREKDFHSASFLWRFWETHESPRGRGGYIFFFPWGSPAPKPAPKPVITNLPPELRKGVLPCGR